MSSITLNQPVTGTIEMGDIAVNSKFVTDQLTNGSGDDFGLSCDVSGYTAICSSPAETSNTGAVYIFTMNSGGTWSQHQKITASDAATSDYFGNDVAIDGSIIAVGATSAESGAGAVYIFERDPDGNYTQSQKLVGNDSNNTFGTSVSLNNGVVVIGDNGHTSSTGAVYIFHRSTSGVWSKIQKITASDASTGDYFGESVSISGDTLVVGAYGENSSRGAAYIFQQTDLGWVEQQKITSATRVIGALFGDRVSISNNTIVIGSKSDAAGKVFVFVRNADGTWPSTESYTLTASDGVSGDKFGSGVSINGGTLIVGANDADKAYIFVRNEDFTWPTTETKILTGTSGDNYGWSVSMGEGLALVGAITYNAGQGAVDAIQLPCIDSRSNYGIKTRGTIESISNITSNAIVKGNALTDGMTHLQGGIVGTTEINVTNYSATGGAVNITNTSQTSGVLVSIAGVSGQTALNITGNLTTFNNLISNTNLNNNGHYNEIQEIASQNGECIDMDGNTMVIGYPYTAGGGEIYIYNFNVDTSTWSLSQTLSGGDTEAGDEFGTSVSIKNRIIVVGAERATVNENNDRGAVYVFRLSGTTWSQDQKLISGDGASGDYFGCSVATNGSLIVAGADGANVPNIDQGAAYIFELSSGGWTQIQKLTIGGGSANDRFGFRASIFNTTILISTYAPNSETGAAYVFDVAQPPSSPSWSLTATLTASDGATGDRFGWSISQSKTTIVVGSAPLPSSTARTGAAYVFELNVSWSQTQKLTASDGVSGYRFGIDVAINNSGSNILIGSYYENSQQGSVYLFNLDGTWSQTQKIVANNGSNNNRLGNYIAISGTQFSTIASGKPSTYVFDIGYVFIGRLTSGNIYGNALTLSSDIDTGGSIYLNRGNIIFGRDNSNVGEQGIVLWGDKNRQTFLKFTEDDESSQEIRYSSENNRLEINCYSNSTSVTSRTTYDRDTGNWSMPADLSVVGAVYKTSGTFRINHPLPSKKDTHQLVHSFVEAPRGDLIYRGKDYLVNGVIDININTSVGMSIGTFEVLCRDAQCFVHNETGWTLVRGNISGAILHIESQTPCDDLIGWMVVAERKDDTFKSAPFTDEDGNVILEPAIVSE